LHRKGRGLPREYLTRSVPLPPAAIPGGAFLELPGRVGLGHLHRADEPPQQALYVLSAPEPG
jgi:hypothetical protein